MYCPNCGRPATQDQRYCKSCGLNLQTVSQALSGQMVAPELAEEERRRLAEIRHGLRTMFVGIGLAIFFFLFFRRPGFAAIGAIVFFVGLGRIASATVFASPRRSVGWRWPGREQGPPSPSPLPGATPPRSVEGPPPSVTEHTTVRLQEPLSAPPEEEHQPRE